MTRVWRNLLFFSLIFGLLILIVFSLLGLFQESKSRAKIFEEQSDWLFASESEMDIDKGLSELDLDVCEQKSAEIIAKFDPFLEGLKKITIHSRLDLRRGLASRDQIWIRCLKDLEEFENILIHEIGHIIDISYLVENQKIGDSSYEYANGYVDLDDPSVGFYRISFDSKYEYIGENDDFVSGYAMENAFEDFAESFLMYVKHGTEFRQLSISNNSRLRKYEFIRDYVFDGYEFDFEKPLNDKVYDQYNSSNGFPYDVSKVFRG